MNRICPHYEELDEIFGGRPNVDPPILLDSGTEGTSENLVYESTEEENGEEVTSRSISPTLDRDREIPSNRKRKAPLSVGEALVEASRIRADVEREKLQIWSRITETKLEVDREEAKERRLLLEIQLEKLKK